MMPKPEPPFRPADAEPDAVIVYAWGLCSLSCCAPRGMDREIVEAEVNRQHPTGIRSKWAIADEPFLTGDPNPCPCNDDPERLHYLLHC